MKKHFKHLKNEKGMTLIELLAVIVIIGIIAAIAVPFVGNLIGDSDQKADVSEAVNIISAAKLKYADDKTTGDKTYTISSSTNDLAGYIDIDPGNATIEVSVTSNTWSIKGHDAVAIAGGSGATSVTEGKLKDWLDQN